MTLRELPRGLPFYYEGQIYYRDYMATFGKVQIIKAYKVTNGRVDFQLPNWFECDTIIEPWHREAQ